MREAAGHHLYLWQTADAFIDQLVGDLNGEVYSRLRNSEDSRPNPLGFEGEIVAASREYITLKLEFGESRFAITDIPPEGLVEIAASIADRTPDSREHYRRRELIAAFAHMTMPESSWEITEALMRENRPFRERWIPAMAAAGR